MHILREYDGLVYVLSLTTASDEPLVLRAWYPTGIRAYEAHRNLGVSSLDGAVLVHGDRPGVYRFADPSFGYTEVELARGGQTRSEWTDELPAPTPKTRRKGKVFWHQGRWMISSSRGWETLTEESSIITREICMERPQHWYAPDLPA
jgi:hypothetical protein